MAGMGDGHDHGDALRRTAARSVGRLWLALGITVVFVVVEAVTAFLTGSLALLSDAAHMLTDGVAIALALGSIAGPAMAQTVRCGEIDLIFACAMTGSGGFSAWMRKAPAAMIPEFAAKGAHGHSARGILRAIHPQCSGKPTTCAV